MATYEDLSPSDLLTEREAAKIIGSTPGTLSVWRHFGRGPAHLKIGRSVRYHKQDLLSFLEGCRRTSTSQA